MVRVSLVILTVIIKATIPMKKKERPGKTNLIYSLNKRQLISIFNQTKILALNYREFYIKPP